MQNRLLFHWLMFQHFRDKKKKKNTILNDLSVIGPGPDMSCPDPNHRPRSSALER